MRNGFEKNDARNCKQLDRPETDSIPRGKARQSPRSQQDLTSDHRSYLSKAGPVEGRLLMMNGPSSLDTTITLNSIHHHKAIPTWSKNVGMYREQ